MFAENNVIPFAHDLLEKFCSDGTTLDFVISPLSIYSALSLLQPGAETESKMEITAILKLLNSNDTEAISKSLGENLTAVAKNDTKKTLIQANGAFIKKGMHIKEAYTNALKEFFKAVSQELDFDGDPEGSRVSINKWVSDETKEKIKGLLSQGSITSQTCLVLVNAVYFKGSWKSKFEKSKTDSNGVFHTLSNQDAVVSMMYQKARYPIADFVELNARGLKIPFECHDMLILLPEENDGFSGLLEKLSKDLKKFKEVLTSDQYFEEEVELKMPIFCISNGSIGLKKPLQKMGLKSIFDSAKADFSAITGDRMLFVSDVFHQAVIEVDEEGAEAAAATAVVMKSRCMPMPPREFFVDHPFLFFIITKEGIPVFMGYVVEPKAKK